MALNIENTQQPNLILSDSFWDKQIGCIKSPVTLQTILKQVNKKEYWILHYSIFFLH